MSAELQAPLSAEANEILDVIKTLVGADDYQRHAFQWRAKARTNLPALKETVRRYQNRPANALPVRSVGGWISNTFYIVREDLASGKEAQS